MGQIFCAAIFITGASGLAAQALLLRELLVSFFGNELVIGVILANWLVSESAGAFTAGRLVERLKNKVSLFAALQAVFSLTLVSSIYLARAFKGLIGVGAGEGLGLPAIFLSSLVIIFPAAFCHGGLFACGCKIYASNPARAISRVYAWEAAGTLAGGIILTFFLIPRLGSFGIVFLTGVINLSIALLLLKNTPSSKLKYSITIILFLGILFFFNGGLKHIQDASVRKQWPNSDILDYRNSIYGNIVVTKDGEQYTFFYNGTPAVTVPYPDKQFVEDFGNLPLLFHPEPKVALIIGGGAGGLLNQALKHPLNRLDYAELDPLLIKMLKKYDTPPVSSELNDPRVHLSNVDGRFFLRNSPRVYDMILIGISKPSDLTTNRLFTQEFFSLANRKLKIRGILSFWLPGSFSYLSRQLRGLNGCVLNALKNTFNYTRVIPGDYNIILASDSKEILEITPAQISERLKQRNITTTVLLPQYLNYRLGPKLRGWFDSSMRSATKNLNSDFKPFALFEALAIWNRQFSKKFSPVFESARELDLKKISMALGALAVILSLIIRRRPARAGLSIVYSVFSTGFFGMLSSLILIFAFQIFYGYLYHIIGLLVGLFMAGAASGSIFVGRHIEKGGRVLNLFLGLELLIAVFSYAAALILTGFLEPGNLSLFIFLLLFILCGFLLGAEFPLAAKIYLKEKNNTGEASGALYAADLLGGWLAGAAGGIILLPVLGLYNTFITIVLFKISAVLVFLSAKNEIASQ